MRKKFEGGGGIPERVKKTKCGGGCEKIEGGGYAGEGKEDKMRGWGGGGGLRKNFEGGGYAGEGREDKMRGGVKKIEGGVCRRG